MEKESAMLDQKKRATYVSPLLMVAAISAIKEKRKFDQSVNCNPLICMIYVLIDPS